MADQTPDTTAVPPTSFQQPPMKQQHASRWIFLSIGIFIAGILLLAIVFISYRLLTSTPQQPSPSPIPTIVITPTPENIPIMSPLPPVQSDIPLGSDTSDNDEDGLTSAEERHYGTDSTKADTDDDGYKDGEEVRNGYNPLGSGKLDSDNDGFPDPDERKFGTDPFNPDTDGDGYSDGAEISRGYNPLIKSPNDKL